MTNSTTPPTQQKEDEIDLIALAKTLWKGRKTVFIYLIIFGVLGVLVAITSPKQYTATTVMVPQTGSSKSNLGGLSSLAAMAGFNMGTNTNSETLSPMVYPQILNSVNFQLELMNTPFSFSDVDHPVSIFEYYTKIAKPGVLGNIKKYTLGLPGVILKAIKGKDMPNENQSENTLIQLTEDQFNISKLITENISLDINDKEGYLTLSSRFHEAILTAQVTQKAQQMLQQYITSYKIEKASDELQFIEERYAEKKTDFEKAQEVLALYLDRNKNFITASSKTEEQRLQSEYSIELSVYNELAKQLEQAKIKVKEDTPVFSIIQPVQIPIEKTKPSKSKILIIWLFLGGIVGVGVVFGKQYLQTVKQKWNETE